MRCMSFGLRALKDSFDKIGKFVQKTIKEMKVFEVNTFNIEPAYFGTLVEVRNV